MLQEPDHFDAGPILPDERSQVHDGSPASAEDATSAPSSRTPVRAEDPVGSGLHTSSASMLAGRPDRRRFLLTSCGMIVAAGAAAGLTSLMVPGCRNQPVTQPGSGPASGSSGLSERSGPERLARTPAPGFAPPSSEPNVRVRVRQVRKQRSISMTVGASGTWVRVRCPGVHQYGELAQAPLEVGRSRRGWSLRDARGQGMELPASDRVEVLSMGDGDSVMRLDDAPFPGSLQFVPVGGAGSADVDVINLVPMEAYLPGVLARELYQHWRPATFEAQAIAARSFALHEVLHFSGRRSYDVTNTTQSQVYGGLTSSSPAVRAAAATSGQVLLWSAQGGRGGQPRVVPGYYSSCCGGASAAAADVIGSNPINDIPPLEGQRDACPCNAAPRYRWDISVPVRECAANLRAVGKDIGNARLAGLRTVRAVQVAQRNQTGRPMQFALEVDSGEPVVVDAARLQRALASPTGKERGIWSSFLIPKGISGGSMRFEGCGHGHGVGLCQYGAEALARKGHTATRILARYYPGASIASIW